MKNSYEILKIMRIKENLENSNKNLENSLEILKIMKALQNKNTLKSASSAPGQQKTALTNDNSIKKSIRLLGLLYSFAATLPDAHKKTKFYEK